MESDFGYDQASALPDVKSLPDGRQPLPWDYFRFVRTPPAHPLLLDKSAGELNMARLAASFEMLVLRMRTCEKESS